MGEEWIEQFIDIRVKAVVIDELDVMNGVGRKP